MIIEFNLNDRNGSQIVQALTYMLMKEKMSYKTHRMILQIVVAIVLVAGVVTAVFNYNLAGFTPSVWFLIAIVGVSLVICVEVTQIRENLQSRKLGKNDNDLSKLFK